MCIRDSHDKLVIVAPKAYDFVKLVIKGSTYTLPEKVYAYNSTHIAYEFLVEESGKGKAYFIP